MTISDSIAPKPSKMARLERDSCAASIRFSWKKVVAVALMP
jgi:hypothetical protein